MSSVKQLLRWHQTKESIIREQQKLAELKRKEAIHTDKINAIQEKLNQLASPANQEEEIQKLLTEQELWMANKELERFLADHQDTFFTIETTISQKQYDVMELQQSLDPDLLADYNRLAENKKNPIVEVKNKSCMGCFMPLSLSKISEWRRAKEVVYCDECGRILV
ncbi:zinc ribbon domain-containing protein [Brevibacillus dissolubilis]|uniref:zinc ribbon domain-containing protein n=1 Tax=Brevibacillus dissolubilis TaxID=1844116 RepID=UPI0011161AE6|nr:C4-type zinc ribbon domain-containing protein [Brevibacillus dissolubilis]